MTRELLALTVEGSMSRWQRKHKQSHHGSPGGSWLMSVVPPLQLGRATSGAEALAEPAAAGLLLTWGQLEIVNALALVWP